MNAERTLILLIVLSLGAFVAHRVIEAKADRISRPLTATPNQGSMTWGKPLFDDSAGSYAQWLGVVDRTASGIEESGWGMGP